MFRPRLALPSGVALLALLALGPRTEAAPLHQSRILFSPESWHTHASCLVELPNGDLLACWFHGSGERTADDVKVEGARLRRGAKEWGPRFTLADTPGFPDCNPAMFLDPRGRLWLVWITIQSNRWESSLLKFRRSDDFLGDGPPRWNESGVIHLKPPEEFAAAVLAHYDRVEPARLAAASDETARGKVREARELLRRYRDEPEVAAIDERLRHIYDTYLAPDIVIFDNAINALAGLELTIAFNMRPWLLRTGAAMAGREDPRQQVRAHVQNGLGPLRGLVRRFPASRVA